MKTTAPLFEIEDRVVARPLHRVTPVAVEASEDKMTGVAIARPTHQVRALGRFPGPSVLGWRRVDEPEVVPPRAAIRSEQPGHRCHHLYRAAQAFVVSGPFGQVGEESPQLRRWLA